MTEKRFATPRDLTLARRRMLEGLGVLSIGAYLPACGSDDDGSGEAAAPGDGAGVAGNGAAGSGAMDDSEDTPVGGEPAQPGTIASPEETTCTLTPEQTEGPFFFDTGFDRSDIREDKAGTELRLS